jgi:hypothetical protein
MGRQLQPCRWQVYIVRTLSLIRQDVEQICNRPDAGLHRPDANPYYENCVQQKCNRPDAMLFRKEYQRIWKAGCIVGCPDALSYRLDAA